MKIFVGNLSIAETNETLRCAFAAYGPVTRTSIETNSQSGQSKGFGFVEMSGDEAAERAIDGLNGKHRNGKLLTVSSVGPYRPKGGANERKPRY